MGYISIYRKWRPQSFKDIVGQDDIIKSLQNAIKINRLSHAYLFCGPRGTGKTSTARILAKAINCKNLNLQKEKNNEIEPCNICENCISITNGTNVDVIEIDAASHRKVEPARDLIESVNYLPNFLSKKVYIIDEVHMLTEAAFNTLLKTLEEPPEHVIFILATTEPNKVPATILSRCQRYNFKPITSDAITKRLKMIASAENIDINDAALSLISKYSAGSQRDANVILEKLASLDEDKIKVEDVAALLGAIDFEILFELTNILIEGNVSEAIFFEQRLQDSYQNLKIFIEEFINHLHTLFIIKNYESAYEILNINEEYKEKYANQAKDLNNNTLQFYIELFSDLYKQLKDNEANKILFRSTLIKAVTYFKPKMNYEDEISNKKVIADEISIKNLGIENKINDFEDKINELNIKISEIQKILKNLNIDKLNINNLDKSLIINKPKQQQQQQEEEEVALSLSNKEINNFENVEEGIKQEKSIDKESSGYDKNLINLIKLNWNNICSHIKEQPKGIPLHAMFIEAKKVKVVKDKIYFYLPDNKKFHKDNLNKLENIQKIKNSILNVTGKQFEVKFFFESEGNDLINIKDLAEDDLKKSNINIINEDLSKNDSLKKSDKEKIDTKQSNPVNNDMIKEQISNTYNNLKKDKKENKENHLEDDYIIKDNKTNEYEYLEKKFGIKKGE